MEKNGKTVLMDASRMDGALAEIASGITRNHPSLRDVVLIGIRTRGEFLARRLAGMLRGENGAGPPCGILDITLYRDDLTMIAPNPVVRQTIMPFDITGKNVILVDDVFYTGRTIRAALDEIMDFGRPARVEVAVLVDRDCRELPIHADYAGVSVKVGKDSIVEVLMEETDGAEEVLVSEKS